MRDTKVNSRAASARRLLLSVLNHHRTLFIRRVSQGLHHSPSGAQMRVVTGPGVAGRLINVHFLNEAVPCRPSDAILSPSRTNHHASFGKGFIDVCTLPHCPATPPRVMAEAYMAVHPK
ncbi:hypothetical protein E2C01_017453 [Portunus trituberculatus]|uniref:Uncharacterized protein n=1 Tax=Portunus trituberculatus TaxID=210409 RepID=A0A5B7DRQ3_PORTR|nr:hypothetical protein [Portunus trituberculatus]